MFSQSLPILAATAALLPIGNCVSTPDDIPEKWKATVSQAWDGTVLRKENETPDTTLTGYHNWALDQIMDGNGTINVCMRWGSNKTLTEATRQRIAAVHEQNYRSWFDFLPGWDNYPFSDITFKVTGWAVQDKSLLQGSTDGFEVHTGYADESGYPTCNPGCSHDQHPDGDYSGCDGGADSRFHHFVFIDPSWGNLTMAAASGPGFWISDYGWETVGSKVSDWPLLLHETGHTFGFMDYIDDGLGKNNSICSTGFLPPTHPEEFVMKPGDYGAHVHNVTEMEGWMVRYWWSRFSRLRGWQSDDMTFAPPPNDCVPEE